MANKAVPGSLIPTVCGAVKVLQVRKNKAGRSKKRLSNTSDLRREGLEVARDAMRRALTRRVLEMTTNGNLRLKVVRDPIAANKRFPESNRTKHRSKGKSKATAKRNEKKRRETLRKIMAEKKKAKVIKMARQRSLKSGKRLGKLLRGKMKPEVRNLEHKKSGQDVTVINEIHNSLPREIKCAKRENKLEKMKNDENREELKPASNDILMEPTPPMKVRLRKKKNTDAQMSETIVSVHESPVQAADN